jgi:hypothetical protein
MHRLWAINIREVTFVERIYARLAKCITNTSEMFLAITYILKHRCVVGIISCAKFSGLLTSVNVVDQDVYAYLHIRAFVLDENVDI